MNIPKRVRPELRDAKPYLPGKPIAEVQRELGIKRVVKLASNESFLGPSPKALTALRKASKNVWTYPEGASPLLRREAAAELDVRENQVLVGNGSDEIIRLLCETLVGPRDEVVCSQYGFIRFKQQSKMMGAAVVEVPMKDFRHDCAAIAQKVTSKTKMVFVASPNNPTGTFNTRAELTSLLRMLPKDCLLVLDEAYYHYAAGLKDYPESLSEFLPKHKNLIVLRTFSKAYGLAGLRIGLGIAHEELIQWIDRIRMPFNVNLPAQFAARAALKDKAFLRRCVRETAKNRGALAEALEFLGLPCLPSAANFLCVQSPIPGKELFRELLQQGVIVRPLDEYGLHQHVRISVGSYSQNRFLLGALKRVLALAATETGEMVHAV
ncbi:MAG: histidinol-phosphate transaminase [Elusimicrobia bacterium]|nr:MAG: histidinol-phosphate transaminase [Elusimicrobiota bacterium]